MSPPHPRTMASREHFTQMLLRHESTRDEQEKQMIRDRLRDERRNTLIQIVQCKDTSQKTYLENQHRNICGILYTITEDPKWIQGVRKLSP